MATRDEPTLLGQLWAKVEPTILTEGASATERLHARIAFLSGANAILVATTRAELRGGSEAVMAALCGLHDDLKREAGSRQVGPRMQ
jgi:hypothetical protein